MGNNVDARFDDFAPQLLKRLLITSQGMHYQAAERSLLLLNSELIQKMVKNNMGKAYPIIVAGLLNGSQQQHWNQTVTTITYQVIRTYMEMSREQFEKLTVAAQHDQKQKALKQKEQAQKWEMLNRRAGVEETKSQFPLVQYKPPEGFEDLTRRM